MRSGWSSTPCGCWVPPFGHPRIEAWSAAPRGLSQPPTSFFGFRRLGIHRWLFVAWRTKDARARYRILKGRGMSRRHATSTVVLARDRARTCRSRAQRRPPRTWQAHELLSLPQNGTVNVPHRYRARSGAERATSTSGVGGPAAAGSRSMPNSQ